MEHELSFPKILELLIHQLVKQSRAVTAQHMRVDDGPNVLGHDGCLCS